MSCRHPENRPSRTRTRTHGRDDRCDGGERASTESLSLCCEASALAVVQPQPSSAELLLEDAVLLDEVFDGVLLVAVDPACYR